MEDADTMQDIVENLEVLDATLLDFEKSVTHHASNLQMVHIMFRYAHNMKGALSILGRTESTKLVHAIETVFDLYRTEKLTPTIDHIDLISTALGALHRNFSGNPNDPEMCALAEQILESTTHRDAPTVRKEGQRYGMALLPAEVERAIAAEQRGLRLYRVNKLVTPSLSNEEFAALPIFADLRDAGEIIAVSPLPQDFDRALPEQLVSFLIASSRTSDDLSCSIFDPFVQIELPHAPEVTPQVVQQWVPAPQPLATTQAKRERILIVEDELVSRELLSRILSPYGECTVAVNGQEALVACLLAIEEKQPFKVVLLDLIMPVMDGRHFLKLLRKIEDERNFDLQKSMNVICTTALGDHKSILGSFRDGCEYYLTKPFDRTKLTVILDTLGLEPVTK